MDFIKLIKLFFFNLPSLNVTAFHKMELVVCVYIWLLLAGLCVHVHSLVGYSQTHRLRFMHKHKDRAPLEKNQLLSLL